MANRTQTADLLKGIAVILMIQVHIIELFANHTIFNSDYGKLLLFLGGPLVAPIFSILFGYFIASSKKTTVQLVLRGLKIIVLGMCLNIGLNLNLIISVSRNVFQVDLLPYIFGVDILLFAGNSIILIAIFRKSLNKNVLVMIAAAITSAILGRVLLSYIPSTTSFKYLTAFFYGSTEWSYFPLFPWLAYPLIGMSLYKIKQMYQPNFLETTKARWAFGFLFIVFLVFTLPYAITTASDLQKYYHHGIRFFSWLILFFMFYVFFINEMEKCIGNIFLLKYIKWLGKNVTLIYIIQWVIIGNIATEIYKTISSPVYLVISFILILFASSVLTFLCLKLKEKFITIT